MSGLFLEVVNMSISAGWLIAAVLLLRLLLRKAPKGLMLVLWGLVGVRLVLPFSLESVFSLIPSAQTLPAEMLYQASPAIQSGIPALNRLVNPVIGQVFAAEPGNSVNPLQVWTAAAAQVWWLAAAVMVGYGVVSCLRLSFRLRTAVRLRENIYQSEAVGTPFVFGIFRPKIYLPFSLSGKNAAFVIAHEQAHIRHGDHLLKPLGFLLLALHWFNPLVWAACLLFWRDLELACDERVVRSLGEAERIDYSQALLVCSAAQRNRLVYPLAFSEGDLRDRVKNVLHYKKPALWIVVGTVLLCVVLGVCFLTDPAGSRAAAGESSGGVSSQEASSSPSVSSDAAEPEQEPEQESSAASQEPEESAPPHEPGPELTTELANGFVQNVLSSLTLWEDGRVTFRLPGRIPEAEDGKTHLSITLNAMFSVGMGTYEVQSLLDSETDWEHGEAYEGLIDMEKGELLEVIFRVAFMTEVEQNAYRQYAADYVELTAPFSYGEHAVTVDPGISVQQDGRDAVVACVLKDGSEAEIRLRLPDGLALTESPEGGVELLAVYQQRTVGSFCLYPFGTTDPEALAAVDPTVGSLPMQVYSSVALSNHAGVEDYQVRKHSEKFAAAVGRFLWQDLSASPGAAADAPWHSTDCVLAYDYGEIYWFVDLLLEAELFSPEELNEIAESIVIRRTA